MLLFANCYISIEFCSVVNSYGSYYIDIGFQCRMSLRCIDNLVSNLDNPVRNPYSQVDEGKNVQVLPVKWDWTCLLIQE